MITAKIEIVDDNVKFRRLMSYVTKIQPEITVLDVETDGLSEKTSKLYGIGLCFNEDYGFYIPWRNQDGSNVWQAKDEQFITNWLYLLCKDSKLIGHNLLFDVLILESNLKIDISPFIYSDTMLLKHTIDEDPPHNLKLTAVRYLGSWADKAQQAMIENIKANGGRTTKDHMDMFKCDTAILGEYCCWDVLLTLKLFTLFEERLHKEGLADFFYAQEVMPLYKEVTIPMKRNGFPVDVPYYQKLKEEITADITRLEAEIMEEIQPHIGRFAQGLLEEAAPVNNKGTFPKVLAEILNIPLPVTKEGKVTLAKKAIEAQKALNPEASEFFDWVVQGGPLPKNVDKKAISAAQKRIFFADHPESKHVFNLNSNDHLAYYLCDCLKYKPLERTPKTNKPKIDADFLDTLKTDDPTVQKLLDYKKLNKLHSTYIEGILERQINSIIYTSMLQSGTTSGRYSSRDPNLQNQPRIKDEDSGLSPLVLSYVNGIRKGFIAGKGNKIVNADYSSLEPVCFAHVSNEEKLRDIFRKGYDLYSQVAIDVNKLQLTYSADKKAPNFLKKFEPELRQLWKVPTLGIVYGMGESRLVEAIGCSFGEARTIIKDYLTTYPNLKKYMLQCDYEAKKNGFVKTEFGRVRHLKEVRNLYTIYGDSIMDYKWAAQKGLVNERRQYKNSLNNAKNFKIQGLGAHIVNRAMIAIARAFKVNNVEGYIGLQVHDEVTCIVKEEHATKAAQIVRDCMQNTTKISVPLIAEPLIADTWADAK